MVTFTFEDDAGNEVAVEAATWRVFYGMRQRVDGKTNMQARSQPGAPWTRMDGSPLVEPPAPKKKGRR